ncbi:DUF5131 family protein (plasmid) [Azospirillum sp. HJ39]|uniref:DUF5131 family protein n=1 Tax=Azospirillum sp. HJ39 TaxID=3159496 RepID=UPI003555F1EE
MPDWPLRNVWTGATVEDQAAADERVADLMLCPSVRRYLSVEPMRGQVDLTRVVLDECEATFLHDPSLTRARFTLNALTGAQSLRLPPLDWVICGGESGPKARPSHPDWVRTLRDQCSAATVPFFFKQWGEWAPGECAQHAATRIERTADLINDEWHYGSLSPQASRELHRDDEPDLYRLGKKAAGRLLDGRTWDEVPEVRP